jgi:hypothetical protein
MVMAGKMMWKEMVNPNCTRASISASTSMDRLLVYTAMTWKRPTGKGFHITLPDGWGERKRKFAAR